VLNACPMVHASGLLTFLLSVNWGAPMIMVERFDPESALDRIERHGCTWMNAPRATSMSEATR
jgi:acyl-CoA synthetase (AMP-forming)/AMP-acid ligase II